MNVGYIGLGIMGSAMAANLLKAGMAVTVWNRTASKADALKAAGAHVAESPADLAGRCDVVCVNVRDTLDVEQVLFGAAGIVHGARAGLIVIDNSTIRPDATRAFARRLAEHQVILLDAPVTGGDVGARNGTLSVMVGGDESAFERCRPIFQAVGKHVAYLGPSGSGQACKACNQIAVLCSLAGTCEAIAFARAQGLDPAGMIDIVKTGSGGSWQLANLGPMILAEQFQPAFRIDLALKDLGIVLADAETSGLSLEAIDVARRYLQRVADEGGTSLGTQAMIKGISKSA